MSTTERVPFRLLNMECCRVLLCWVNSRLPNYCPECGRHAYPQVRGWITARDDKAMLKMDIKDEVS